MADEKTIELLQSWGFGDLVTTFEAQGIDYEALISLLANDKEVEQLLPKIGLRLKFKKQLLAHLNLLNSLKRADSAESLPSTMSLTSSIFTSTSDDSVRPSDDIFDLLYLDKDFLPSDKYLSPNNDKHSSSLDQKKVKSHAEELSLANTTDSITTKNPGISSKITKDLDAVNDENLPPIENFTPNEMTTQTNILSNFAQLDLKNLLLESPIGSLVLSLYESNKGMDKSTRLRLVQTVIRSIIQKLPVHDRQTMKNAHFEILAKKIVQLFPSENEKIYYIPPFDEGPDQQISKGKLVVRYRNEVREFRKCGFFMTKKSKSKDQTKGPAPSDHDDLSEDIIRQCTVHFEWLKHNTTPWSSIEEHWVASQPLRFREYKKSAGDEVDVFEEWPVLKQPLGHSLLEKDFSGMFDDKLSMYAEWPEFSRKVQNLMQTEVKSQQYRDLLALLNGKSVPEATRDVLILTLLPALCPPVARIRKGKGYWRPTIVESINGFIRHVKTPGDMQPEIEKRIIRMKELKQKVQPYVMIVGPELVAIENSYVIIDSTIYHTESTLKAVDICFKAFQVLHAKYPMESEQIWLLLQKCIYKMETKWDKKISSTFALIAQINKC